MNDELSSGQLQNYITDVNDSWQPNKGLNILTGVNGSGKTRVLDYIYSFTNPIKNLFAEPIWTPREDEAKLKLKNELKLIPNDGLKAISNPIRMQYLPVLWRTYSEPAFKHEIIEYFGGVYSQPKKKIII